MNYNNLGSTGLSVSEIALGCEGFAEENYSMAAKLLDLAEKEGVNYLDIYSPDPVLRSAIGKGIVGRREKFILQSHICSVWENGQYLRTRSLQKTKAGFEESLKLFGTNYIDVGMIHYCDAMDDWQKIVDNGILEYAKQLKAMGKIHHIGLSSHNPIVAMEAVKTGDIEVLMFSVNPVYDLQPPSEDVEDLWSEAVYSSSFENMDPYRQQLYELCRSMGVGITVMKAFAGGDLLNAELSPAGVALSVNQCIHYCLTRPAVACVLAGAHSVKQLEECLKYENASDEEKDYAAALASFPKMSWHGHCMYCSHCAPCPKKISVADVTKFLNLALSQGQLPETVREHYKSLAHHAEECISCGICESRCPFGVEIRQNMNKAKEIFGY